MNFKLRFLFFSFFLSLGFLGNSQNETQKWFFGTFPTATGLDFSTSPPTVLGGFNSSLNTITGCASACNASGALLFYSDGVTVWNSAHQVMPNGTGLKGITSNPQSCLIVKQPGNASIYFLFTIDTYNNVGINTGIYGLRYSVVDMSLAAGQGSVTSKNNVLFIPSTEKMAAVKHCNGNDVWLVSHDRNTDVFRTFLISSSGISTTAVTSTVGTINADYGGYLKFSPDGNKLATSIWPTYNLEIYDFDRSTGIVSNQLLLRTGTDAFGCEFSSDGTKFYSVINWSQILQWNLCAGTATDIIASQLSVGTSSALLNGMQLAPDGKIYVMRTGQKELGVIQSPNATGTACNYVDTALSIAPRQCHNGLPNFMASYLAAPAPTLMPFTTSVSCQSLWFKPPVNSGSLCKAIKNYVWDFGDPASGLANSSNVANPVHNYISTGTYTVKLILNGTCTSDTIVQTLQVSGCTGLQTYQANISILSVSPIPVSTQLMLDSKEENTVMIFNELGALVFTQKMKEGKTSLNVSELNNGIYFLKATSPRGTQSMKFVKID